MSACDRFRRWPLALHLFEAFPTPDAVLRATALSCCATGALWRRAAELLEEKDNVMAPWQDSTFIQICSYSIFFYVVYSILVS